MTTQQKVESLIRQTTELPEEAQAELVQSLVEMRSQHLGIYNLDADEREALARSAEDERLGRFATDDEIDRMFDPQILEETPEPDRFHANFPQ